MLNTKERVFQKVARIWRPVNPDLEVSYKAKELQGQMIRIRNYVGTKEQLEAETGITYDILGDGQEMSGNGNIKVEVFFGPDRHVDYKGSLRGKAAEMGADAVVNYRVRSQDDQIVHTGIPVKKHQEPHSHK